MKVILKQDVKGLGKKGDLANASDGYARNFLFPRNFAIKADAQNMTEFKNAEQAKQHKIDMQIKSANANKQRLQDKVIKMTAKAGQNGKLFGSVTAKDIATFITKEFSIKVDKRKITVDDIKTFGTYNAEVKLYNGITATVKVMVSES